MADSNFDGFGGGTVNFLTYTGARIVRAIRSTSARVDVQSIDVYWQIANPPVAVTVGVFLAAWRTSIATNTNPPNSNNSQPGAELLWAQRLAGSHVAGQAIPSPLGNLGSYRFAPGILTADNTQILWVTVSQPFIADNSGTNIYAAGSASSGLSVLGMDYSSGDGGNVGPSNLRSLPRWGHL